MCSPDDYLCGGLDPDPLGGCWDTVETVPQAINSMSGPWRQNKTLQAKSLPFEVSADGWDVPSGTCCGKHGGL